MQTKPVSRAKTIAGFTLIELMVTVAVVAILGTMAVTAYTTSVRKSRRTEARTALMDLASREERFMSTNSAYSATATDLGYGGTFPQPIGSGYYQILAPNILPATNPSGLTPGTPATFSIQATPVPGKGQDKDAPCQTFTVDNTGKQSATNSGSTDSSSTCWN